MQVINLTVLEADEGKVLFNEASLSYGTQISLASGDSQDNWVEMTQEEADRIIKENVKQTVLDSIV